MGFCSCAGGTVSTLCAIVTKQKHLDLSDKPSGKRGGGRVSFESSGEGTAASSNAA